MLREKMDHPELNVRPISHTSNTLPLRNTSTQPQTIFTAKPRVMNHRENCPWGNFTGELGPQNGRLKLLKYGNVEIPIVVLYSWAICHALVPMECPVPYSAEDT